MLTIHQATGFAADRPDAGRVDPGWADAIAGRLRAIDPELVLAMMDPENVYQGHVSIAAVARALGREPKQVRADLARLRAVGEGRAPEPSGPAKPAPKPVESPEQGRALDAIRRAGEPLTISRICEAAGLVGDAARTAVGRLASLGHVAEVTVTSRFGYPVRAYAIPGARL